MQGFRLVRNKFFSDVQDQVVIEKQLASYNNNEGAFADLAASMSACETSGHVWCKSYGQDTPQLQRLAMKVLSQVTMVSACERNWSTFDFIHSRRQNRSSTKRAANLMFVFNTLQLKNKVFDPKYKEEFMEWSDSKEEFNFGHSEKKFLCFTCK